jgi:hypothetical protein
MRRHSASAGEVPRCRYILGRGQVRRWPTSSAREGSAALVADLFGSRRGLDASTSRTGLVAIRRSCGCFQDP